eukprot:m.85997 g.85997  ORF g.85997 m.85997 type:complete len:317 (+) comp9652_c0_seq1:1810-2760(+)
MWLGCGVRVQVSVCIVVVFSVWVLVDSVCVCPHHVTYNRHHVHRLFLPYHGGVCRYHVKRVLDGASLIVNLMDVRGESVLIHCSDGWDRTAQLSTLTQIMMDSHSRTVRGFMAVIHKEWLSFGHKFEDRLGTLHLPRREISPVFTQCLDCIWQLMRHHPTAFEFSSSFLVALHYAVHSSEYGTFLCNSEKERLVTHELPSRTRCLWRAMERVASRHANPRYVPSDTVLTMPVETDGAGAASPSSTEPPSLSESSSEPLIALFKALYIPRGLPRDTLHHPRKSAVVHRGGGDPDWPEILTVQSAAPVDDVPPPSDSR